MSVKDFLHTFMSEQDLYSDPDPPDPLHHDDHPEPPIPDEVIPPDLLVNATHRTKRLDPHDLRRIMSSSDKRQGPSGNDKSDPLVWPMSMRSPTMSTRSVLLPSSPSSPWLTEEQMEVLQDLMLE